jgi:hypothetical protein
VIINQPIMSVVTGLLGTAISWSFAVQKDSPEKKKLGKYSWKFSIDWKGANIVSGIIAASLVSIGVCGRDSELCCQKKSEAH